MFVYFEILKNRKNIIMTDFRVYLKSKSMETKIRVEVKDSSQ